MVVWDCRIVGKCTDFFKFCYHGVTTCATVRLHDSYSVACLLVNNDFENEYASQ